MGELLADDMVSNTCSMYFLETSYYHFNFKAGTNNFYGCHFYGATSAGRFYLRNVVDLFNCVFNNYASFNIYNFTIVKNVTMNNTGEGFRLFGSGDIDGYNIFKTSNLTIEGEGTAKNLYGRQCVRFTIWQKTGNIL